MCYRMKPKIAYVEINQNTHLDTFGHCKQHVNIFKVKMKLMFQRVSCFNVNLNLPYNKGVILVGHSIGFSKVHAISFILSRNTERGIKSRSPVGTYPNWHAQQITRQRNCLRWTVPQADKYSSDHNQVFFFFFSFGHH
jgi:hypothetical protein